MKKLLVAALALSCASAFAGNAYVGVNAGQANQKLSIDGESGSETSTAYGVNVGYKFTPIFGAEAGYVNFGEASASDSGVTIGAKPTAFYLAATATWAVTPEFAVFAKAGASRSDTKVFATVGGVSDSIKQKQTSGLFGVGLSYAFTPAISAVAEFTHFGKVFKEEGASLKVYNVSAGVRFSF
jgi:OOP family OmpA-OmpF porin